MSMALSKKALLMFETDKASTKSKKIKSVKKKAQKNESADEKIQKLLLMSSGVIDAKSSKKVRWRTS
jgi:hypothetical protein